MKAVFPDRAEVSTGVKGRVWRFAKGEEVDTDTSEKLSVPAPKRDPKQVAVKDHPAFAARLAELVELGIAEGL